jgi:hypothetical protein
MGRFLTAWSDSEIVNTQTWQEPRAWEMFEILVINDQLVAFKTCHGKYLRANHARLSTGNLIDGQAVFTLKEYSGNEYAIRSSVGLYLCVDKRFNIEVNRTKAGPWERLAIV